MNEQIKQIAQRLKGLREVLELTITEIAIECDIAPETYSGYESGEKDIPVSFLHAISKK